MSFDATFVHEGKIIDYTPNAAVNAGDIVVQGNLVGIAKLDIAANTLGALSVEGVYDIVKASGVTFTVGANVYWNASDSKATSSSSGTTLIGTAVKDAESGDAVVRVLLNA